MQFTMRDVPRVGTQARSSSPMSYWRSSGLLGFLDNDLLSSLGLRAWSPFPKSSSPPPPPCREELNKSPCPVGGLPTETQGHSCPTRPH